MARSGEPLEPNVDDLEPIDYELASEDQPEDAGLPRTEAATPSGAHAEMARGAWDMFIQTLRVLDPEYAQVMSACEHLANVEGQFLTVSLLARSRAALDLLERQEPLLSDAAFSTPIDRIFLVSPTGDKRVVYLAKEGDE